MASCGGLCGPLSDRYIKFIGASKSVNRQLEAKTRALAGWKGYTTNLVGQSAGYVIDAYHQLWCIERSFRMSKPRGMAQRDRRDPAL
jgi:hypothetical protein